MQELGDQLIKVQQVNTGTLARIRSVPRKDADSNAIIILDSFSQILSMAIEGRLSSLEYLFQAREA